jgi:hypothetical protein
VVRAERPTALGVGRHLHLVVDRAADDATVGQMVAGLSVAVPAARVCVELVPRGDTMSAGHVIAGLALRRGPPGRVVAHDVEASESDPGPWPDGAEPCFCAARTRTGVLVVGSNEGWIWSWILAGLTDLIQIDVPSHGAPPHRADRLARAVAHADGGHSHAIAGTIDRREVPVMPGSHA